MRSEILDAAERLSRFAGPDLGRTLSKIEERSRGVTRETTTGLLAEVGASKDALAAAATIKALAGQINVTIHALGILRCLPHILQPGEVVEYVSLGAGNTGRPFDLETNLRVAEFKFITCAADRNPSARTGFSRTTSRWPTTTRSRAGISI